MAFQNPEDSGEILYGISGDVRNEINANAGAATSGHYVDETEMPGALVIRSLRRATRIVNSYLEVVYADQIPVTSAASVPKILDEIATDLGTFYCLRSLTANLGPIDESKKRDYFDQYIDPKEGMLSQIRDRQIQIPEFTSSYADDVKAVRSKDRSPIFDVDSDFNHNVDPDLLDDISDERSK